MSEYKVFERSDVKPGLAIMIGIAFVVFTLAIAFVIWRAGSSYFQIAREKNDPHLVAKTAALFPAPRISEAKALTVSPNVKSQFESETQRSTDELVSFAAEHKLIRLHFDAGPK